jgi:DNA invertase Pin-like site-specific DNA recombinase
MRAAIYARYSTDQQREESIDDQIRACERLASAQGIPVVGRFDDRGISGGTTERAGYQALLVAARAGAFEVIIAEDISRLWRSRAEFGPRSAELEDLNVHLVTCVGDDTRRDGYGLVLGIKSAIAEHQRREISYRTRRGMEGLAAAGKSTGGRCYGYGSPAEADTVRRLFRERAAGMELREMVAALTRAGTPAPRGPRWSYNAVRRILANPRYAGRLIWGATVSQGGARDSRLKRHVKRPDGPLVAREIPALVDPLVWRACNPGAGVV